MGKTMRKIRKGKSHKKSTQKHQIKKTFRKKHKTHKKYTVKRRKNKRGGAKGSDDWISTIGNVKWRSVGSDKRIIMGLTAKNDQYQWETPKAGVLGMPIRNKEKFKEFLDYVKEKNDERIRNGKKSALEPIDENTQAYRNMANKSGYATKGQVREMLSFIVDYPLEKDKEHYHVLKDKKNREASQLREDILAKRSVEGCELAYDYDKVKKEYARNKEFYYIKIDKNDETGEETSEFRKLGKIKNYKNNVLTSVDYDDKTGAPWPAGAIINNDYLTFQKTPDPDDSSTILACRRHRYSGPIVYEETFYYDKDDDEPEDIENPKSPTEQQP